MKHLTFLPLFFFLFSCANRVPEKEKPAVSNKSLWLGKSGDDVLLHPVYSTLPMESRKTSTGIEVRSYTFSGGIQSRANCAGGGCSGQSEEVKCFHTFHIKNNLVSEYRRMGSCNDEENYLHRPLGADGVPLIAEEEKEYYKYLRSLGCLSDKECTGGKVCATVRGEYPGVCTGKM